MLNCLISIIISTVILSSRQIDGSHPVFPASPETPNYDVGSGAEIDSSSVRLLDYYSYRSIQVLW